MRKITYITSIFFLIVVVGALCYDSSLGDIRIESLGCRRGARGIVRLIEMLSHLDLKGWGYLLVSSSVSLFSCFSLKRIIPFLFGNVMKFVMSDFTTLIVPKNNISISIVIFLFLFSFTGYWSPIQEDKEHFLFVGVGMTVMMFFVFLCTTFRNHAFVIRNGIYYRSRFALFGVYLKFDLSKSVKEEMYDKNGNFICWKITDENNKTFRVFPKSYSEQGQILINGILDKVRTKELTNKNNKS